MSAIRSPFSSRFISQFLFNTYCLSPFFTWVALSDVELRFSLVLVKKANAVEEETKRVA
jgi:hypothetical protein